MRITNLFWTVVLLAPLSVFAQQQKENLFTIDAQIRTRGEYRNGVLNPRPELSLIHISEPTRPY